LWKKKEEEFRELSLKDSLLRMEALRDKAVSALEDGVESGDESIKLRSAQSILDRTGLITGQTLEFKGEGQAINLFVPKHWNNQEVEEPDSGESE
jgi:hypothetical protein